MKAVPKLPEDAADSTEQAGTLEAEVFPAADPFARLAEDVVENGFLPSRDLDGWSFSLGCCFCGRAEGHAAYGDEEATGIVADGGAFEFQLLHATVAEIIEIMLE